MFFRLCLGIVPCQQVASPRMRGGALPVDADGPIPEGVPAYAGMSPLAEWAAADLRSGPRVCGDEPDTPCRLPSTVTWSPRVRG